MSRIAVLSIAVLLFSACSALPEQQPAASAYDFGMPPVQPASDQARQVHKSILIADASAPSWLDTTAIRYRLLYHNAAQAYIYANSRWAAPPAALLTQHIRNRIASQTHEQVVKDSGIAKTDYVLHIELEEFTQLFDSIADSRIAVGFRASLVERSNRKLLAQKDFNRIEIAPSADAEGAISAFSAASRQLTDELVHWLAAELGIR
ncbi:MAG: ABC-type transport auxiliary lipoprotein family protein [Nitrosomonas sp.]|nr:MAG: ABC-type transport auxiliary lipoprotein family protein [Nitrosomonas sp.]